MDASLALCSGTAFGGRGAAIDARLPAPGRAGIRCLSSPWRIRSNRRAKRSPIIPICRVSSRTAARVGDKWEPYFGELLEARCWAINLAKNYAVDEGITFVLLNDEHDSNK